MTKTPLYLMFQLPGIFVFFFCLKQKITKCPAERLGIQSIPGGAESSDGRKCFFFINQRINTDPCPCWMFWRMENRCSAWHLMDSTRIHRIQRNSGRIFFFFSEFEDVKWRFNKKNWINFGTISKLLAAWAECEAAGSWHSSVVVRPFARNWWCQSVLALSIWTSN